MVRRKLTGNGREIEPAVHGGNWREASVVYGRPPEELVDYSANINPMGPPTGVLDCLARNLDSIRRYPDPESTRLKESLAKYLSVAPENILTGNGAVEIIYLLLQALRPSRVLIPEPTFNEYRRAAQAAGAVVVTVLTKPEEGFKLNLQKFVNNLSHVDIAFLCNPNNPTGNLIPGEMLEELAAACHERDVFLVVDESFIDFLPEWRQLTLCSRAVAGENLLVLRSLTKFFALPGLRLGAAIAGRLLVNRLERNRDPWNVNILAQMAGPVALQDHDYMERTRELVSREREYLSRGLTALGLKVFPGAANFLLVEIGKKGWHAAELAGKMGRCGFLIRDCSSFPGLGPSYIRLAVKDREANRQLLEVLKDVLTG